MPNIATRTFVVPPVSTEETLSITLTDPSLTGGETFVSIDRIEAFLNSSDGKTFTSKTVGTGNELKIRDADKVLATNTITFWIDEGSDVGQYTTTWKVSTDASQTLYYNVIITIE